MRVGQSLSSCIDARGKAGRATSHDHHIVVVSRGEAPDIQLVGQLGVARLDQDGAVGEHDRGNNLLSVVDLLNICARGIVLVDIVPLEGDALLVQELLGPSAIGTPWGAVHPYPLLYHLRCVPSV